MKLIQVVPASLALAFAIVSPLRGTDLFRLPRGQY